MTRRLLRRAGWALAAAFTALSTTAAPAAEFQDCPDCPVMVAVPAGKFMMGNPAPLARSLREEQPSHAVTVKSFALGRTEVTQAQWSAVMGSNPSKHAGDMRPVDNVSWRDALEFAAKLSAKTGKTYRLPTEAEWEYAARAGSRTTYAFGNAAKQLGAYAWFRTNSANATHPVALKKPNRFGLYDMHGNVWEWVYDCYVRGYAKAPTDGTAVPEREGCSRMNRGGSFRSFPDVATSWSRMRDIDIGRLDDLGLRIARDLP